MLASALISPGAAANDDADAAFRRGVARYEAGDHAEAAAAFQRAYELDPKPIYLFSLAQTEVGRDRCREANEIFRRYLETDPPEANKQAAESRIKLCEERLAAEPPPEPSASATPPPSAAPAQSASATPSAEPAPPPTPPPAAAPAPAVSPPATAARTSDATDSPTRWWTDPLAMGLLAVGVAAAGVGTGVTVWGQGSITDARDQTFDDYQAHQHALDAGHDRRIAGGVTIGVGAAMIVGGVIRAIVVEGRVTDEDGASASAAGPQLWLEPGAVGLGASGRF